MSVRRLRVERLEHRDMLSAAPVYSAFATLRNYLAPLAEPASAPKIKSINEVLQTATSTGVESTSTPLSAAPAQVVSGGTDRLTRLVRDGQMPLIHSTTATVPERRTRPLSAQGFDTSVAPKNAKAIYPAAPTAKRISGFGTALYNGNTATSLMLTAPVLPGNSKQVDLTIGTLTTKSAERMGVNVGDMNSFTQGNIVNNLITQVGTFELANARVPVHASNDTTQGLMTLVVGDAYQWRNLGYASAIGATITGLNGANKNQTWTIADMRDQTDSSGKATGRAIITLASPMKAKAVEGDTFFVSITNFDNGKLANYIDARGNSVTRDNTIAHGGSSSARLEFLGAPSHTIQMQNWFGADSTAGRNVLQPGHTYEMSVWIRSTAGGTVRMSLGQGSNWNTSTVALISDGDWHQYTVSVTPTGPVRYDNGIAELVVTGDSQYIWADDWKVTDKSDEIAPGNPISASVAGTLRDYGFGELRFWHGAVRYASVDDLIGPRENRHAINTLWDTYDPQVGLPEMLELAKQVGANPWIVISPLWTKTDLDHLMEYLGGDVSTPYGAKRAADGHAATWFSEFQHIELEAGNESWNGTFSPFAWTSPMEPYFDIAQTMFSTVKSNPVYAENATKMSLVVNGWQWVPWYTNRAIDMVPAADAVSVSSYMGGRNDASAGINDILGSVMAQQLSDNHSEYPSTIFRKKVYVYEMNAGELGGGVSKELESTYATSLGAGLAVARQSMTLTRDYGITNQNLFQFIQRGLPMANGYTLGHYGIFADMTTAQTQPRPVALAAKLMNRAAGQVLTSTLSNGWMIDSTATQGLAASTQAADAMVTYNGESLIITMFNTNIDDTQNTTFHFKVPETLTGASVKPDWSKARFDVLSGPAAASGNETSKTVDITAGTFTHGLREVFAALPAHSMGSLVIPLVDGNTQF